MNDTMTAQTARQQPINDDKIQYVTYEEAAEYDKLLDKHFIRRGTDPKTAECNKNFFYMIISVSPSCKGGHIVAASKFTMDFQIQKYYRKETIPGKVMADSGITRNIQKPKPVARWGFDAKTASITGGELEVIDEDASFGMDSRKFLEQFVAE